MRKQWKLYILVIISAIFIAACSREPQNQAQGYIEGRYTYIATNVSGILRELPVERGTWVKQGQTLFSLEPQPESDIYHASADSLKQSIDARDAIADNLAFAKITYERYKVLVPQRAIPQSQLDSAQSTYYSTVAQLAQANATIASATAALAQAQWTLNQKSMTAPVDAIVFDTYYRIGEYTLANQPIMSLLAPRDIKAIFYVLEPDMNQMKLGDKVSVYCDACKRNYSAVISFISPTAEYTPPLIYSNETSPKLIFRIEAEFAPRDALLFHPGEPVTVTYGK